MAEESEQVFIDLDGGIIPRLLGVEDSNLRYLEGRFQSQLVVRGDRIIVKGPPGEASKIRRVFLDLESMYAERKHVTLADIDTVLRLAGLGTPVESSRQPDRDVLAIDTPCGTIQTRGFNQARYLRMMEKLSIVFAIGPAGTGKTYLAVAKAVESFQRKLVEKIILTRPVLETGERLGFLPGDILEKVDPYFRPLYDALDDMLTRERVRRLIERGSIEVAPLAYMRGRTLNHAFVILDEAQNTTSGQMKMFLTRLGDSSRAVLTGDLTQVDLPVPRESGLFEARDILIKVEGIGFIEFSEKDVVRHRLVADILRAYNGEHKKE